jgi:osmotically-inducible protein OsmY
LENGMSSNLIGKLGALAAGALAMYYLDPQMGAQRRRAFADLLASGLRGEAPGAGGGYQRPRVARRTYHQLAKADPQSDAELRDRIRERLGRLVSHPRALDVSVDNGVVRLSGDVLAKERDGLLLQVREMEGVQKLVNAMTAHESPAGIAALEARAEAGESAPASA